MPFTRRGACAVAVAIAVCTTAPAAEAAQSRPFGDTRVFAGVPEPGQPAGIAVDGRRVLVSTAGVAQPTLDPRLFVYESPGGRLVHSHVLPAHGTHPAGHPVMTSYGVVVDAARRAYVVDMNGRVVRIDPESGAHDEYAAFPASVGGVSTMPFDIVFDDAGFAYVSDNNVGGIWRVPPGGGAPELWFQDPRLLGYLFGPGGVKIDPLGRYLYFTVVMSQHPATARAGLVYRLPTVDEPSADQLQEVYRYPSQTLPMGIAFGASRKLFVALAGPNQISVLRPGDGERMEEEQAFPSAEENSAREMPYEDPIGVAFDGCGSLLVTNSTALTPPQNPARQAVLDVFVGDRGAPLPRPAIPGAVPVPAPGLACAAASRPAARCLVGRLPVGPRNIGRVRLGDTRRRMLSWVRRPPARRLPRLYGWCVKRNPGQVTAVFGAGGRSVLVTSTAGGHGNRGVRPGTGAAAFRRAYPRRRRLAPGVWRTGPGSFAVVGLESGRVRFVGVADRGLVRRPQVLVRSLRLAGL